MLSKVQTFLGSTNEDFSSLIYIPMKMLTVHCSVGLPEGNLRNTTPLLYCKCNGKHHNFPQLSPLQTSPMQNLVLDIAVDFMDFTCTICYMSIRGILACTPWCWWHGVRDMWLFSIFLGNTSCFINCPFPIFIIPGEFSRYIPVILPPHIIFFQFISWEHVFRHHELVEYFIFINVPS